MKCWRQFWWRKIAVFSKILLCSKSRDKNLSNEPHKSITRQKLAILIGIGFLWKFFVFKLYSQNDAKNADLIISLVLNYFKFAVFGWWKCFEETLDEMVRERIRRTWSDRLKGCKHDVDVWEQLLQVRSLVLSPKEDEFWSNGVTTFLSILSKTDSFYQCLEHWKSRRCVHLHKAPVGSPPERRGTDSVRKTYRSLGEPKHGQWMGNSSQDAFWNLAYGSKNQCKSGQRWR